MRDLRFQTAVILIATALVFTGCNKSSTPSPAPTATPAASNISGDYTGTVTDSIAANSGTVNTAILAQKGNSAGGFLVNTTSGGNVDIAMSLVANSSNSASGSMVIDHTGGATCTYSVTGTYTNNGTPPVTLNGTYSAVTNCAGETGSFALTQQCSDTATAVERRTLNIPVAC